MRARFVAKLKHWHPTPIIPIGTAMQPEFQLAQPLDARRIVVAMSGGVDSSVVAALAAKTGAEVIGVTLQLYDHGAAVGRTGSCCAGQDIRDARAVADRIGIAHYVFDYESRFRESVIADFADEYMAGRTPIPCVKCNMGVKFTDLFQIARDLGADCLATGHYVRRVEGPQGAELHRAADPARDQSYFLFATTQAQLDYLRFPLGALPKPQVREIAAELGLAVALKPDSQDICFVPDGDYAKIVRKLRPDADEGGDIVHIDGRVLGRHKGMIHFTVGEILRFICIWLFRFMLKLSLFGRSQNRLTDVQRWSQGFQPPSSSQRSMGRNSGLQTSVESHDNANDPEFPPRPQPLN